MTNREKLLNTNIYDLLLAINKRIIKRSHAETCVLEALEDTHIVCGNITCDKCIQRYLNKKGV